MRVHDIMTREVVSCRRETDVGTAGRSMFEKRFGTLPVVDADGKVLGIITDRDIAMAAATRQRNASVRAIYDDIKPTRAPGAQGQSLERME